MRYTSYTAPGVALAERGAHVLHREGAIEVTEDGQREDVGQLQQHAGDVVRPVGIHHLVAELALDTAVVRSGQSAAVGRGRAILVPAADAVAADAEITGAAAFIGGFFFTVAAGGLTSTPANTAHFDAPLEAPPEPTRR